MERGIGKKASFNQLFFADEYDDGWEDDYDGFGCDYDGFDYDCHECDYDGGGGRQQQQLRRINPKIASAKYLAARARSQQRKTPAAATATQKHKHSSGITISNARPSSSSSASASASSLNVVRPTYLRYYNRDPKTRILTTLDNNSLLHVATFLDLKSIAGWSCTGKFMDEFLSPDALYCTSSGASLEKNALMLPCAKKLPYHISLLPRSGDNSQRQQRPKGMARAMAHEADRIFFGNGNVRNRNLAVASHIRCKEKVDSTHLFDRDAMAIVTKTCEVEIHWFGSSASSVKGKRNKAVATASKSRLKLPSCDELLKSTFHTKTRMVALFSTVTAGRRYMLSLVQLPSFRGDAPEIILQAKLPPCTLSSHLMPRKCWHSMSMGLDYYWGAQRNSLSLICISKRIECGRQVKARGILLPWRFTTSSCLQYAGELY